MYAGRFLIYTYCQQDDVWWLHRILRWQQDSPVINATLEVCGRWPLHREMPLEQVVLERRRVILFGSLMQLLCLPH